MDSVCRVLYNARGCYDGHPETYQRPPKWLLVDKTFLEEGSKMLRLHGMWLLYNIDTLSKQDFKALGVLSPAGAEYLRVPFVFIQQLPGTNYKHYELPESLQNQNSLRKIEITFYYRPYRSGQSICISSNDLITLENLTTGFSHLQELILHLYREDEEFGNSYDQLQAVYRARTEDEIPAIAKRILGDGMVQSTEMVPGSFSVGPPHLTITFKRK
jgi:hypothetical protein